MRSGIPAGRLAAAILSTLLVACCGDSGDCAPDDAQAALGEALTDADPGVRLGAVTALALRRDLEAAEALSRAAADPDPGVRHQAREALRVLADDGIVPGRAEAGGAR